MKILYGVTGEGMGHATRSHVILEHLSKNHEVLIVASGKAYSFLKTIFPNNIIEIEGFSLEFENHELNVKKSIKSFIRKLPYKATINVRKFIHTSKKFSPDLIISDFESFSYLFGKLHDLPVISIDNMQIISRCDITVPPEFKKDYLIAKTAVMGKLPHCFHYLIATFFPAQTTSSHSTLIPPILRNEILKAKPIVKDHVLVYLTTSSAPNLLSTLKNINEKFVIYGFNKNKTDDNLIFKEFSNQGFIDDLASSKAVVSTSGFSLMTEAIYLHKPFFALPIHGQFEQVLNGIYLKKLGYGDFKMEFKESDLKKFLSRLEIYQDKLDFYSQDGNKETLAALDELIKNLL